MNHLKNIFSSNNPIDCYLLKGRLESEGIRCFIFDEHTIDVHPFRAVAIGGVKLKVPTDKVDIAKEIITLMDSNLLIDSDGLYELSKTLSNEENRQDEILRIKAKVHDNPELLEDNSLLEKLDGIVDSVPDFINEERRFLNYKNRTFKFNWKQFWCTFLDFDESVIDYFKIRPNSYYLDEEIIQLFNMEDDSNSISLCPICGSSNVKKGMAVDFGWNVIELISVLLGSIFIGPGIFIPRSNYHCFNCGFNYKNRVGSR